VELGSRPERPRLTSTAFFCPNPNRIAPKLMIFENFNQIAKKVVFYEFSQQDVPIRQTVRPLPSLRILDKSRV
jgi:hypothetical protein